MEQASRERCQIPAHITVQLEPVDGACMAAISAAFETIFRREA
jgi:hypothetical protein